MQTLTRSNITRVNTQRVKEGKRPWTAIELAVEFTITPVGQRMGLEPQPRHVERAARLMKVNK